MCRYTSNFAFLSYSMRILVAILQAEKKYVEMIITS